ncbi:MAG: flp pilus-assembly TadE/G-like family protein [Brachybacterium sp.]|nr:flp pilus-assembly TadE/G-like family protein [Brachybacterium sp.]MDN5900683.1 flp pilus-assembly TadE/G-like family protein [Brachybacterium sp.]
MSTGAASVLAWTGAATTMVAGLSLLGTGLIAQSRAATAADLASLAAADAVAVAHGHPCDVAAEVATRNGARMLLCEQRDWDVLVTVEVDASPLSAVSARSRAGPGPAELP